MKVRISVSVDEETNEKLRELAAKGHTNVSQWISDRVWEAADISEEKDYQKKSRKAQLCQISS